MAQPCESCGAPILFAKQANGKTIPLNKTRVRVYVYDEETQIAIPACDPDLNKITLFHISHFLTCPNASSHSIKRGKTDG